MGENCVKLLINVQDGVVFFIIIIILFLSKRWRSYVASINNFFGIHYGKAIMGIEIVFLILFPL